LKVYIAQLKCPGNHCVVALVGQYASAEAAQKLGKLLLEGFEFMVEKRMLNRECGICHSTALRVEVAVSIFATMEEARPWLLAEEQRQIATAQAFKAGRN
jgi:hypothetical protein